MLKSNLKGDQEADLVVQGVKIEPKAEDTSRPRGRSTTKVKLEDGTETSSKRRGRPAGSKNKPK